MKFVNRSLAGIGALVLVLIAYSVIRSPQGTFQTAAFIGAWWIEPFTASRDDSNDPVPDIISNPDRTEVAGAIIAENYGLELQDEVYANFLGDGHCIVIARLKSDSEVKFPPASVAWTPLIKTESELLQFLRESTPYSDNSTKIDPILDDPGALISIQDLQRNGGSLSNLRIFVASPQHKTLLEWGADF